MGHPPHIRLFEISIFLLSSSQTGSVFSHPWVSFLFPTPQTTEKSNATTVVSPMLLLLSVVAHPTFPLLLGYLSPFPANFILQQLQWMRFFLLLTPTYIYYTSTVA